MAGDGIRFRIHSVWDSFVPSAAYLCVYAATFIMVTGWNPASNVNLHSYADALISLKRHPAYEPLKDMNLIGSIPLFLLTALAVMIYVFDRFVFWVGRFIPPWSWFLGSTAPYVDRNVLIQFWLYVPSVENPAALDSEAREIVDRAKLDGKGLPSSSLELIDARSQTAWRSILYGKVGVLWTMYSLVFALHGSGGDILSSTCWATVAASAFALLVAINLVRAMMAHIETVQERMFLATQILAIEGRDASSPDFAKLLPLLANMEANASRYLRIRWTPNNPFPQRVIDAVTGFGKVTGRQGKEKNQFEHAGPPPQRRRKSRGSIGTKERP